ncbi:hypothetical protein D3P08_18220 [Paenibacillus nanensis]|uniref:Knr4/Smi1-like domain-containing protein n=1 Tax=Paenibacillus nanensis TaxID=393251 RepID=A0A3A1UR61_9BACL|nr:SMI1/KNR4 family protein [Paenibacillus nanensis]RIX51019.1 hypothetical protein D3P08_18220 [Paenibacillus nanensis]
MLKVEKTIAALRELYSQGTRKVQCEEGFVYDSELIFYEPAASSDLSELAESYSPLPEDYLTFLSITNGFRPFSNVGCSGEIEIFSINEVFRTNRSYRNPSKLIVAYVYDDYILMDLDAVAAGKREYMFLTEGPCSFEYARSLYCDFQT